MKLLFVFVIALCATHALSYSIGGCSCGGECASCTCGDAHVCDCGGHHECTECTCVTGTHHECDCHVECGHTSCDCCNPICIEPIEPIEPVVPEICICSCCEQILSPNPNPEPEPCETCVIVPCPCEPDAPLVCEVIECPVIDLECPEPCGPEDPCLCAPETTCLCGPICSDIEQGEYCPIVPETPVCPCEPCDEHICCDCCGSNYEPEPCVVCPEICVTSNEGCEIETYVPEYVCPEIIVDEKPVIAECVCDCEDFVHLNVECESDLSRCHCCDIGGDLPVCCDYCIDVAVAEPCCYDEKACTCGCACEGCSACVPELPCDVYHDYECHYCPSVTLVRRECAIECSYEVPEGVDIQEYCRCQIRDLYEHQVCECGCGCSH